MLALLYSFTPIYVCLNPLATVIRPKRRYTAASLTSSSIGVQAIKDFFNFAVLYAYMVPISLYVSLELVKLVQVRTRHHNIGSVF